MSTTATASWTMTASNGGGGGGEKAPPGNHPAVLVGIFDMGTQKSDYQGVVKWNRRAYFAWELVTKKNSASGRNHVMGMDLTMSFADKAKLKAFVESWLGRAIPAGESFDVSTLLGKPCLLSVKLKGEWPRIDGVAAVPELMTVPPPQTKPVTWLLAGRPAGSPIDIPEWVPWLYGESVAEHVKRCKEWGGDIAPVSAGHYAAETPTGADGEVPF
jgi:hypothetical protein